MKESIGVAATPPGLRPFGAEPAAQSQAEPLVPNAMLRDPASIWEGVCVGREGYCSSDLQAAAKAAIAIAQQEALAAATALAPSIGLLGNYLWSDSNFRKFQFGVESLAAAITALATGALSRALASGIEARSDETPQAAQPEGQEPDPKGDVHE